MSIRYRVEQKLKEKWMSNFQLVVELKSSSADRAARTIRENPPIGFKFVQRPREVEGYNKCLEFKLIPESEV